MNSETGGQTMFEEYYGVRLDLHDEEDCVELIRILETNGYKCYMHTDIAHITESKYSVSVSMPNKGGKWISEQF